MSPDGAQRVPGAAAKPIGSRPAAAGATCRAVSDMTSSSGQRQGDRSSLVTARRRQLQLAMPLVFPPTRSFASGHGSTAGPSSTASTAVSFFTAVNAAAVAQVLVS